MEGKRLKCKKAFDELASLLDEDDLRAIEGSSWEFRGKFALR
jgi:hypothetical protein